MPMPVEREPPSLTDWVMIAIGPALIMLMVGSLVFFLIEVLYDGQYSDRLLYTMFFFVFASVLLARLSIEEGYSRAALYAIALAAVTYFALQMFVEYPNALMRTFSSVISIGLIVLIYWATNKLTWDCTHIDEDRKSSGRGVLAAAGLDAEAVKENPQQQKEDDEAIAADQKEDKLEAKKRQKDTAGTLGWMDRWNRYKEAQKKKPHTPGTWVVYFSLAALPLFGLGQSLISPDDVARRRATFMQMTVYVGSGLGLLVTTSLLGLRKYLRERGARIPNAMTFGWLGLGAGLIVMFLVVGAVLPRPHSETPLVTFSRASKEEMQASKNAMSKGGSTGKGEGTAGEKTEGDKNAKPSGKADEKGGVEGKKGDGSGKGKDDGGKGKDGDKKGEAKEKDGKPQNGKPENNKENGEKKNDEKKNDGDKNDDGKKDRDNKDGDKKDDAKSSSSESPPPPPPSQIFSQIAAFIKWVVWIVIVIAVIVGLVYFFLKFLAPFTQWAKNLLDWLKSLFAKKKRKAEREEEIAAEKAIERPPPFSEFPNPFADGSAKKKSLISLVEYSFAALDAWAWDRDTGRTPDETPNEFAARIGEEYPDLDEVGRKLANLYVRVLYSGEKLPAESLATLIEFWRTIETPIEAAVAAE